MGNPRDSGQDERTLLAVQAKQHLRNRHRGMRLAIPGAALAERSQRICGFLAQLDVFHSARALALFWPLLKQNEVDCRPLFRLARDHGKGVFFPFMEPDQSGTTTGFRRADTADELAPRGHGFAEPPRNAQSARAGELDLIVVPALAVTPGGHRLGYGAGFYDVTLPEHCPPAEAVVVAYDFELLPDLPLLAHDFACHQVVTDARVLVASGASPERERGS